MACHAHARPLRRNQTTDVLVEGYMDVIALVEGGLKRRGCPSWYGLTEDQFDAAMEITAAG